MQSPVKEAGKDSSSSAATLDEDEISFEPSSMLKMINLYDLVLFLI